MKNDDFFKCKLTLFSCGTKQESEFDHWEEVKVMVEERVSYVALIFLVVMSAFYRVLQGLFFGDSSKSFARFFSIFPSPSA